jgi:hypothetical protein
VAELLVWLVLLAVIALLLLSVWRQFNLLGRRGQLLDSLSIIPQWKFFALSTIETREDSFDDFHLLTRFADGNGEAEPWQSLLWNDERKWFHILWNPYLRANSEIQMHMMHIVNSGEAAHSEIYQTSLSYLTVLRHCLDNVWPSEGSAIQFAIVTTRGRHERPTTVRFVSAWHTA